VRQGSQTRFYQEGNWLWPIVVRCVSKSSFATIGEGAKRSSQYDQKLADEDAEFQKATPTGSAEFVIDNPKATGLSSAFSPALGRRSLIECGLFLEEFFRAAAMS